MTWRKYAKTVPKVAFNAKFIHTFSPPWSGTVFITDRRGNYKGHTYTEIIPVIV